jgi:hypothetical protein
MARGGKLDHCRNRFRKRTPAVLLAAFVSSVVLLACGVDSRPLDAVASPNQGDDLGSDAAAPPSVRSRDDAGRGPGLGDLCSVDADCSSGFCVDGVCCDGACAGVCEQCGENGHCDVMPADDAACPEVSCPESSECQSFAATLVSDRCIALGVCRTSSECPATLTSAGTLCDDAELAGVETRCDGEGRCADARRPSGASCALDAECAGGVCAEGVCCQEACDGVCEVCSGPEGTCIAIETGTPEAACGEDGRTCFGRGACSLPLGRVCESGADCGSGACVAAAFGVAGQVCCERECDPGQLCSGDGLCVEPSADLGQACGDGAECALGARPSSR